MNEFLESLEEGKPKSNGGAFPLLNIARGETRTVRVIDKRAVCRDLHFFGRGRRPIACPGTGCLICERQEPKKPIRCCLFNVVDREHEVTKVLCVFSQFRDEIANCVKKNGAHDAYDMVIKRAEEKNEKQYTVSRMDNWKSIHPDAKRYPIEDLLKPMSVEDQRRIFGKPKRTNDDKNEEAV